MDLYYGPMSGNSARTLFAVHEAGLPYTPHCFDSPNGANRQAPYLALNPMGKVPALVDGDVRLWESNAINWYLAEKHPEARLLPASLAGRASVQRWLLFQAGHIGPACHTLLRAGNARVQAYWKLSADPSVVGPARQELARYLAVLEEALGDGREWLEGAFSLADIAYAPHLALVAETGFDLTATPRVHAWLQRLWARRAWKEAAERALRG
jgi:glutathione S-transferase